MVEYRISSEKYFISGRVTNLISNSASFYQVIIIFQGFFHCEMKEKTQLMHTITKHSKVFDYFSKKVMLDGSLFYFLELKTFAWLFLNFLPLLVRTRKDFLTIKSFQ